MEKILTIAIPAYNVERYLRQCLDSFLVESVLEEAEVLIINDGSEDFTEQIGLEYQRRFPDSIRVITKENGGHGSAINTGIEYAQGKYFKIVDGDDWVNSEEWEEFIHFLKSQDCDLVASNFRKMDHTTQLPLKQQERTFYNIRYNEMYKFQDIYGKAFIKMHSMTIRTSIFKENNIKISEHCFYVDAEYIFFPIPYIKNVIFYEPDIYMYRLGLPGQSIDIKKMQKNMSNHTHVLERMLRYYGQLDQNQLPDGTVKYMQDSIGKIIASQVKIYISFPLGSGMRKKLMEMDQEIKKKYPEIYNSVKNNNVWIMRKTRYLTFPLAVLAFSILSKKSS